MESQPAGPLCISSSAIIWVGIRRVPWEHQTDSRFQLQTRKKFRETVKNTWVQGECEGRWSSLTSCPALKTHEGGAWEQSLALPWGEVWSSLSHPGHNAPKSQHRQGTCTRSFPRLRSSCIFSEDEIILNYSFPPAFDLWRSWLSCLFRLGGLTGGWVIAMIRRRRSGWILQNPRLWRIFLTRRDLVLMDSTRKDLILPVWHNFFYIRTPPPSPMELSLHVRGKLNPKWPERQNLSPQVRCSPGGFSWLNFTICAFSSVENCKQSLGQKGLCLLGGKNGFYCFKAAFLLKKQKKKNVWSSERKVFLLIWGFFFQD